MDKTGTVTKGVFKIKEVKSNSFGRNRIYEIPDGDGRTIYPSHC